MHILKQYGYPKAEEVLIVEKDFEVKQIVLVTDGHSNTGGDPCAAAANAEKNGVIVNAIGIASPNSKGIEEVEQIALAGGGCHQIVELEELASSMIMLTQSSIQGTIEGIVNKQLRQIMGKDIENIPPNDRCQIIDLIDRLQDEVNLKVVILIDTSGSMADKLLVAKESILSLFKSLETRKGKNLIAVMGFPGRNGRTSYTISGFTDDLESLKQNLEGLRAEGATPTALAIRDSLNFISDEPKGGLLLKEQII
ncbi:MAG: Ca-activated chloride channel [Thermosediminibacterales bacterium]|nr:Ca-activated chloride channel [Thermosediminibacterales bacterium]